MDVKKALVVLALVFLGVWVYNDPTGGAEVARSIAVSVWRFALSLVDAVVDFVGSVV